MAFAEVGLLHSFAVSLVVPTAMGRTALLGNRVREELRRRTFEGLETYMRSMAVTRELARILGPRLGWHELTRTATSFAGIDSVVTALDRHVAQVIQKERRVTAVYGYEDTVRQAFEAAKRRGIRCLYELPIGHWRAHSRICAEEAELQPQWAHTWSPSGEPPEKIERKDRELALADAIVVPSVFVRDTLRDYPGKLAEVHVVPYGGPQVTLEEPSVSPVGQKLRIVYVGAITQRKGIAYMIEALEPLRAHVEVVILGNGPGLPLLPDWWIKKGNLPHELVLVEMQRADVFVFPTLFEGYSLAVSEALSQGLPVITTPHSGAGDMIESGQQGWVVPIRDAQAITARLEELIKDRELLLHLKQQAKRRAASWQWEQYREQLRSVLGYSRVEAAV